MFVCHTVEELPQYPFEEFPFVGIAQEFLGLRYLVNFV
jgi:hypothetical protein